MVEEIQRFLRETLAAHGYQGVVLGVSGGIDSAVAGRLAVDGLGRDRVYGLILPERDSAPQTVKDARLVCAYLGINYAIIRITPILRRTGVYRLVPPAALFPRKVRERYALKRFRQDALHDTYLEDLADQGSPRFREGLAYYRIKHRVRMCLLYMQAEKLGYAVLGTTNRSELKTGFYVKWGDDAADIEPLAHLHKSQVFELARRLAVPPRIIAKPPSPDLVPGITDEFALGIEYADLDRILRKMDRGEILDDEPRELLERTAALLKQAQHRQVRNLQLSSVFAD